MLPAGGLAHLVLVLALVREPPATGAAEALGLRAVRGTASPVAPATVFHPPPLLLLVAWKAAVSAAALGGTGLFSSSLCPVSLLSSFGFVFSPYWKA